MSTIGKRKFDYSKFLEEIHIKRIVNEDVLNRVVMHATKQRIANKQRIVAGEANEIYDITLSNGSSFIVRIARNVDEKPFEKEKWAIEKVKDLGVPTPEIIHIENTESNSERLSISILTKIVGVTMDEFPNMNTSTRKTLLNEAGRLLSLIHTIPTQGFHHLNNTGVGEYNTFKNLSKKELGKIDRYLDIAKRHNINPNVINNVIEILTKHSHVFFDQVPYLNHGDFEPKHIMTDGERITGIIDWGNIKGNSPIHDFVWWDFWRGEDSEQFKWLKEGYTNKKLFEDEYDLKFSILKLYLDLDILDWCDFVGNLSGVNRAEISMTREVNLYNI